MKHGFNVGRRAALGLMIAALAGCGRSFRTFYPAPLDPEVTRDWRLNEVRVTVPPTLSVSDITVVLPQADIVWREDPPGDRREQVARIVAGAARAGAAGLQGQRPVDLHIVLSRFHALTMEAEAAFQNAGVHNIDFTIAAVDAETGAVLAGPDAIEAAEPAFSGEEATRRRAAGETQKSVISAHLRAVVAGWLGLGPDPRRSFRRLGR